MTGDLKKIVNYENVAREDPVECRVIPQKKCWGRCFKTGSPKKMACYVVGVTLMAISTTAAYVIVKIIPESKTEQEQVISTLFASFLIGLGSCGICMIGYGCCSTRPSNHQRLQNNLEHSARPELKRVANSDPSGTLRADPQENIELKENSESSEEEIEL